MEINLGLRSVILVLVLLFIVDVNVLNTQLNVNIGEPVVEMVYMSQQEQEFQLFIDAIGQFESNGRYDIVSKYGFWGRYQFSPNTVRHLGFDVTREEFLSNPRLQDVVMITYIRENYESLLPYIKQHNNTHLKGVPINIASILAGAHFAGAMGVKRFLSNDDTNGTIDSNGMTLRRYMTRFSMYEIEGV